MRRPAPTTWLVLCAPLILAACATIGPPQPPSLRLPQPPSDLRASRKGDRVTLTWTLPNRTTDRETIRGLGATRICRGVGKLEDCGTPVGQTPALYKLPATNSAKRPEGSHVDALPVSVMSNSPDAFATYAVEVLNQNGHGAGLSNQVRVPLAHTLPPPVNFEAKLSRDGVVLSWSASASPSSQEGVHHVFRVYRYGIGSNQRILAGEVPLGNEQGYLLTDSSIEWQKTYEYRVVTVTLIDVPGKPQIEVEGDDTPAVKIFADDVFPPAVPTGLQAVFSGPGQKLFIDLVWAPVTDADLAGYNVYRSEDGGPFAKINSELVGAPAYRDSNVQSGKHYTYAVTSVDSRANESARSEPASESVP
jgi:hypothetical protein